MFIRHFGFNTIIGLFSNMSFALFLNKICPILAIVIGKLDTLGMCVCAFYFHIVCLNVHVAVLVCRYVNAYVECVCMYVYVYYNMMHCYTGFLHL